MQTNGMRLVCLCGMAILIWSGCGMSPEQLEQAEAHVVLVRDGVPAAVIQLDADADAASRQTAAEIVNHIQRMTGVELPVIVGREDASDSRMIRIRNAQPVDREDAAHVNIDGLVPVRIGGAADETLLQLIREQSNASDAFALVVARDGVQLRGLEFVGAQHAAFELLEQLGVRWHDPLEEGRVIPIRNTVTLDLQETVRTPSAELRLMPPVTPRSTIYTLRMKDEHMTMVRRSSYVMPTESADDDFVLGHSSGWTDGAEYFYRAAHVPPITERDGAPALEPVIPPHNLYGYVITDPDVESPKTRIVLTDGNHTEHTGSWSFHATIEFLLSDDPRAATMRRKAEFYVYPMLNPDGRYIFSRVVNPEIAAHGWPNILRVWLSSGTFKASDILAAAMRYDTRANAEYQIDYHSNGTVIYSPSTLRESALVRAMAAQNPAIRATSTYSEFSMPAWAVRKLNAKYVFQLEHGPWTSLSDCREIGRAYALGLHDVLTGKFVDGEDVRAPETSSVPRVHQRDASDLSIAVGEGDMSAAHEALEAGDDIDGRNSSGNSALHLAVEQGHDEIAEWLIASGADVSLANRRGWTPLHYAVRYGTMEIATLLIEHGALVDVRDVDGDTPLHLAAAYNRLEIVTLLLDAGANADVKGRWGRTPLDWARRLEYEAIARELEAG